MEVGILGRFVVTLAGRPVEIGSRKRRLLLAVLLTAGGTPVSVAALADALWSDQPPASAPANLRQHLYRLRAVLGHDRIVRQGDAVLLRLDGVSIDAYRFVELAAAGEKALATAEPVTARELLGEALGLWQGRPFAELGDEPALAAEVTALRERHLAVLRRRIDVDLALGRHADVVPELTTLIADHPYQESFYSQLMLALYHGGRTADALAVFTRARRILADDLGLEPGPELREREQAILRQDESLRPPPISPPAAARSWPTAGPAELPADTADFTGRTSELAELDQLTGELAVAVVGPAGVGKSAFAIHWGHAAADRFPDGQLFVALHGFSITHPTAPIDALAHLLRALGMPDEQIPADVDEAAARYRTLLAGRRMLIVLDNARSADQVRMLLPGRQGSLVVITSRSRLPGLFTHAVRRIKLGPLPTPAAIDLLRRTLPAVRVDAEPDAAAALAAACGHLPLALRVAAANLTDQPGRLIADYVAELRPGRRLAALTGIEGDSSLRPMFDSSYAVLDPTTQLVFRRISLISGPDFTAEATAVLANVPVWDAAASLARLADAHLVQPTTPGRYTMHDLVSEYAALRHGFARQADLNRLYPRYADRCLAAKKAYLLSSASSG